MKKTLVIFLIFFYGQGSAQCDTSLSNSIILSTLKYYHNTLNKISDKEIILADSATYTSERAMTMLLTGDKELETIVGQTQVGELVGGIFKTYKTKKSFSDIGKCKGIKTISTCVIPKIFNEKNGWAEFRKKHPDINGFYVSTVPYINTVKDKASIVVEYVCGGLCGECYKFVLILNKDTNSWEVKYKSALFYH